ncbi:MAG: DUF4276 family protein [Candidatus Latescibacteria bacterium]|nr:DUF4276 family protein [Candidatus Latescibacterota bacterium]
MHLEVLVEEPSAEAALKELLPKILKSTISFHVVVHGDKGDLLKKLPSRLQGYRAWMPSDWRIMVLIDEDRQDCRKLKFQLERIAREAGFTTKSSARSGRSFQVLNRLAVEELEAWFFGDVNAILQAFPRIPRHLGKKSGYRDPDAIAGGTWEALERILQRAGYFPGGLPKIETARRIARFMNPGINRSKSFQVFRDGLFQLR